MILYRSLQYSAVFPCIPVGLAALPEMLAAGFFEMLNHKLFIPYQSFSWDDLGWEIFCT